MDFLVSVALADDTPAALLQIARSPWRIEVMERNKPVLYVHSGSHLKGAAHKHAHLSAADFCEKLFLAHLRVCLMDICDLFMGNALFYELVPNVVIDGKCLLRRCVSRELLQSVKLRAVQISGNGLGDLFHRCCFRRRKVTEQKLCQLLRLALIPYSINVVHALINLAFRRVRQVGVYNALVKAELASIGRYLEHIIDRRINNTGMNLCGAVG